MADISRNLSSATAKHVAALFYGSHSDFVYRGSADFMCAQGTLTLIAYGGMCLGVTNKHVVETRGKLTRDKLFFIALERHTPLPGRLLFTSTQSNSDFAYDIAVFLIDEATIVNGGKLPIQLDTTYETIGVHDQALAVGFPGVERKKRDQQTMEHPLYHVVAKCVSASDRTIVLHENLPSRENKPHRFGGMSGGAIFRVKGTESFAYSGIIFQGRGFGDTESGRIEEDIWVYGFPFGPKELQRGFDVFSPTLAPR